VAEVYRELVGRRRSLRKLPGNRESPAIGGINAPDIPVSDFWRTVRPKYSRQWLFNQPVLVAERKLENAARVLARAAAEDQGSPRFA
jgi:hypothetical protein